MSRPVNPLQTSSDATQQLPEWLKTIAERFAQDLFQARVEEKYTPEKPVAAARVCMVYNQMYEALIEENGKSFTPKHLQKIAIALLKDGHPIIYNEDGEYFYGASHEELEKHLNSLNKKHDALSDQIRYTNAVNKRYFQPQLELLTELPTTT